MISAWHLLWIIPVASILSVFSVAITTANRLKDEDIHLGEPLDGYYIDGNLNIRKREDDGKQDA